MNNQNIIENIKDRTDRGLITADQANVEMVRSERVRIVTKLRKSVRDALNKAVKSGELSHMKKNGLKPEVYYHPDFKYLAMEARSKEFYSSINAIRSVCA